MLDLHQTYLAGACVNAVAAVLLYILGRPFGEVGIRTWSWSLGCASLGCLLLAFSGQSSAWIADLLTSAVVSLSTVFRYVAINQLYERPSSRRVIAAALALILLFAGLAFAHDATGVGNILGGSVLNVFLMPLSLRQMWRSSAGQHGAGCWMLSGYLFILVMVGLSDIYDAFDGMIHRQPDLPEGNQLPAFLMFMVLVLGAGGAFLNIVLTKWVTRFQQLVTERSKAQALEEKRALLSRLDRDATVHQMSGALVHEVSQPISALLAQAQFAQMALAQGKLEADATPAVLEKIVASARRAVSLLDRFRSFSRGNAGPVMKPLSLSASVRATLQLLEPQLSVLHIRSEFRGAGTGDFVLADDLLLSQVVMNLARNAANAMQHTSLKLLSVTVRETESTVVLEVRDTGTGIATPREGVDAEAFSHGVGLRIVRDAVGQFGGCFEIENREGGGAQARVTLPRHSANGSMPA